MRTNGKTDYYHSMLAVSIVAPGHAMVLPLMPEFIAAPDLGFHPADGAYAGHGGMVPVGSLGEQPIDGVDDSMAANRDLATVDVSGLDLVGDRSVSIGEVVVYVPERRRSAIFQCEQIVGTTIQDRLRGFAVAVNGIGRDQRSLAINQLEQAPRRYDFGFTLAHRGLEQ
jgi:hypothetical protein